MLIFPRRHSSSPLITFYLNQNRIVLNSAATEKIKAKPKDRLAFQVEKDKIELVFHPKGFTLNTKKGSDTMLNIGSAEVTRQVRKYFAQENENTLSFLIGTREDNKVEVILNSKRVLK